MNLIIAHSLEDCAAAIHGGYGLSEGMALGRNKSIEYPKVVVYQARCGKHGLGFNAVTYDMEEQDEAFVIENICATPLYLFWRNDSKSMSFFCS
jgi:hypothetical protein